MPLLPQLTVPNHVQNSRVAHNPTVILNAGLMLLCAGLVLCYIIWANALAASNYQTSMLHTELIALNQVNSTLQSQKTAMENPTAIAAYAAAQHMIPATNVSYVFESNNVAVK